MDREEDIIQTSFQKVPPAWYAAYTCSRREKQVARVLEERHLECYLPLYAARRRGTHKGERILLPLFPGYVFVHIATESRRSVLQVPGIVHLVSFSGQPAALADTEIEKIRKLLSGGSAVEPYPYLKVNHEAEICSGPLRGLRGRILRHKGRFRVVLSVDLLHQSVAVDVDSADLNVRSSTTCRVM